jgi:hypothetical protein
MRFIICAVAASALLGACATRNDEMAMDTSSAASNVSATAPAAEPAYTPEPTLASGAGVGSGV